MAAGTGPFDDPDNYLPLARSLAAGQGLAIKGRPTAYRPPLYPILLAPIVTLSADRAITAIAIFHLVLGGATAGTTAVAARRWGLSRWRVIAATWIVAIDPVLAWQSRFIMTETLTAFLIASALAALTMPRWREWVLGAAFLGLASLSRPSMLPGAVLVVIAGLLVCPGACRDRLARCGTMALTLILVLSPWAIRNALIFGEPVWTTTHGGYTLALANNEVYYRDVLNGPPGGVWMGHDQWLWWDSVNRETSGMSEPHADRFLRNRVVELAMAEPLHVPAGWSPAPGAILEPDPGGSRVLSNRALGDGCLDPSALDRPGAWARPSIAVALAPDRRTSSGCWPELGSRRLLD